MKYLKILFIFFLLAIATKGFAQLDTSSSGKNKGSSIGTFEAPAKTLTKPETIGFGNNDGFKNANKEQKKKQQKSEAERKLLNKGMLTKTQLNNLRAKELYGLRKIEKVDEHQGDFLTNSKNVTLFFRDFANIDGDIVAIKHNGVPVVIRTTLTQFYQSYQIHLKQGLNKIEVIALNQGTLGANTAQYKLINKEGFLIASQYWYLATGAKATFHVTKN